MVLGQFSPAFRHQLRVYIWYIGDCFNAGSAASSGSGRHPLHALLVVVVPAREGIGHRGQEQSVDDPRVVDTEPQRGRTAHRIANHVGFVVAEPFDQLGDVGRHVLEGHRAFEGQGAAVPLEIDADHLARLGEFGQHRAEHLDGAEAAMQQHQRFAAAVQLVIELDAVDGRVAGGTGEWS